MAPTKDLIVAADFGTSGVKVGLVDRDLDVVASRIERYPLHIPADGWAEQKPEDWWGALERALKQLATMTPDLAQRAAGLVLCAQMCGLVCADAQGRALRPCLIWLDKRSDRLTRRLVGGLPSFGGYNLAKMAQWLYLANGAPSLTGMDPPGKMVWVRDHEPAIWQQTHRLLDAKDWLVHRASGQFVTTPDSANLTWMMDTRERHRGWSRRLRGLVRVPQSLLPKIVDGTEIVGGLRNDAAATLGLPPDLPVLAGSGDVCATAIGTGAVGDGELHISMGTSSWIGGFFPTRRLSVGEAYATISSAVEHRPLLIATQESAGACLSWICRILMPNDGNDNQNIARLFAMAAAATENRPPLFLPWLAGERVPADDSRLRGGLLGLSLDDDRDTIARAVLEGVVLNTRWAFESVRRQKGVVAGTSIPLVGGVGASLDFCQMLANCLRERIIVDSTPRLAGVRGAAALAATGLGWMGSPWDITRVAARRRSTTVEPDARRADYFDDRFGAFVDAHRRTRPWFHRTTTAAVRRAATAERGRESHGHD